MSNTHSNSGESPEVLAEQSALTLVASTSFPNPGRGYHEGALDLNLLNRRPASSFMLRIHGSALASIGLLDGDEVLVDRALDPAVGRVLVVVIDGERRIGVMQVREGRAVLVSDLDVLPLDTATTPWGVATIGIKHLPGL